MINLISKNDRRKLELQRGSMYGALLVIFLIAVELFLLLVISKQVHERRAIKEFNELKKMEWVVQLELEHINSDLSYFSESAVAKSFLENRDSLSQSYLTSLMKQIISTQNGYTHIRIMDTTAVELICINNSENGPIICIDSLSRSGICSYPKEITTLSPQQLYTQQLKFIPPKCGNQELFNNIIQISIPIFSSTGERLGIGIVNYLGEGINEIIANIEADNIDHQYLLNADGQYLKGAKSNSLNTDGEPLNKESFSTEFPLIWKKFQDNSSGVVITNIGELYYSSFNLTPHKSVTDNKVILVIHIPAEDIHTDSRSLHYGLIVGFIFLAPMLFVMGWKQGKYQVHQKWLFHRLEIEATHDSLTGLLNRRAILEHLKLNLTLARRRNSDISVGFIDLNNLKNMNDTFGHDAGDELILGCAKSMMMVIRSSDSGARMGGDEFMIVFPDCDIKSAENIMERIQLQFASIGLKESGSKWSMSYGCSSLESESDTPELLVERADSKMYKHKLSQKSSNGEVVR